MKTIKKLITTFLCLCLVALCCFTVSAEITPVITISDASALPGEAITVDISISNNPGIMAMAFCITYDSDALQYKGYSRGYLTMYTVKNHTDKGHVSVVIDESSDKSNNGVIISLKFNVKDDAPLGKYKITLANLDRQKYGERLYKSFSNSNLKSIEPFVNPGIISVGTTCEDISHKYGEWEITTPADCNNTGTKTRICVRCDHSETATIPITHDFEDEWTVDKAATPTEDGIMSRHCQKCDVVTDEITFTYEEVEDSQNPDNNTSSDDVQSDNDNSSTESTSSNTSSSNNSVTDKTPSNKNDSATDTATSSDHDTTTSQDGNSSDKTPINNTVGSKNPLSSVENIKDYQENVKPNINNNTSSTTGTTENQISSDNQTQNPDADTDNVVNENPDNSTEGNDTSPLKTIVLIISAIISIAIIVLALILIIRRKK